MNKIISTLTLSVFLGISGLSANGVDSSNLAESKATQKLSQADSEFLFGTSNLSNLNVEILTENELKETQGQFWSWQNFAIGLGVGVGVGAINYGICSAIQGKACGSGGVSYSGMF